MKLGVATFGKSFDEFLKKLLSEPDVARLDGLTTEQTEQGELGDLGKTLKSANSGINNDNALRGTLYRLLTPGVSPASMDRLEGMLVDWSVNQDTPLENVKHMSQILKQVQFNITKEYGTVLPRSAHIIKTVAGIANLRNTQANVIQVPKPSHV